MLDANSGNWRLVASDVTHSKLSALVLFGNIIVSVIPFGLIYGRILWVPSTTAVDAHMWVWYLPLAWYIYFYIFPLWWYFSKGDPVFFTRGNVSNYFFQAAVGGGLAVCAFALIASIIFFKGIIFMIVWPIAVYACCGVTLALTTLSVESAKMRVEGIPVVIPRNEVVELQQVSLKEKEKEKERVPPTTVEREKGKGKGKEEIEVVVVPKDMHIDKWKGKGKDLQIEVMRSREAARAKAISVEVEKARPREVAIVIREETKEVPQRPLPPTPEEPTLEEVIAEVEKEQQERQEEQERKEREEMKSIESSQSSQTSGVSSNKSTRRMKRVVTPTNSLAHWDVIVVEDGGEDEEEDEEVIGGGEVIRGGEVEAKLKREISKSMTMKREISRGGSISRKSKKMMMPPNVASLFDEIVVSGGDGAS